MLKRSNENNTDTQLKTLENNISIVARDTQVYRITRKIRLNSEVHKCARNADKTIIHFVHKFMATDLENFNLTRTRKESPEIQLFPMTLLLTTDCLRIHTRILIAV